MSILTCFKKKKVAPEVSDIAIQLEDKDQKLEIDHDDSNPGKTDSSGKKQVARMIGITFVPIVVLIAVNAVFVRDATSARRSMENVKHTIASSIDDFGGLLHHLQIERGTTALYISSLSSHVFDNLEDHYVSTNEAIANVSVWSTGNVDSSKVIPAYFETKYTFQRHLQNYRQTLDANTTLYDVMDFYTEAIDVIVHWFIDIRVDTSHTILSKLVAYELLVLTKEQNGVKRALGSSFYALGGFRNHSTYLWFMKEHIYGDAFLETSIFYTETVKTRYNDLLDSQSGLLWDLQTMETEIMLNDFENLEPSWEKGDIWFSQMSLYLNILLALQFNVADDIMQDLDEAIAYRTSEYIVSTCGFIAVLLVSPVIIQAIFHQTRKIQQIGDNLQRKTVELEEARDRAGNLLHQMLPPIVAKELMSGGSAHAEYYEDVTIFYSSVVNFTVMCGQSTPMQVVEMLNTLYQSLDELIKKFDAYKVETTGDAYMVASGIPTRNNGQHAMEIASMSIVIQYALHKMRIPHMVDKPYDLRIGIHTGPCAGGVVGKTMPRYCLFGDSVNTASAMETTSQANKIHMSEAALVMIQNHKEFQSRFVVISRGSVTVVKGRPKMKTYWLESVSPLE